ncbi:hypothetical protein QBC46DRAFT_379740 [Diplogelasinospora grovesii]|uniref:Uncharacterized protein n=1 Tax=Diplogelasinospora grovesii TaxID=303347 RepID=A0AAN6NC63_9PEZI|nr:hypothetical protein QBC46DRAFT_379740 [Diplogelasinospora grovesii]
MPNKSHHRSRSSIDRVLDLLADLQDTQVALLLEEINSTTTSNVPVSQAHTIFEPGKTPPKRRYIPPPSSPRSPYSDVRRRQSKRMSSAPELSLIAAAQRPKTASQPPTTKSEQQPESQLHDNCNDSRPSLALSPPEAEEQPRPQTATEEPTYRQRSYKRISRPIPSFLYNTSNADLPELLLAAYLYDTPISIPSTATASPTVSPTTPHTISSSFSASIFSPLDTETDMDRLDLLEPSPLRKKPSVIFGKPVLDPTSDVGGLSGIFEVLTSH